MKKITNLNNLGAFVGLAGPGYLVGSVERANELGAKSLMFYPGSPRLYRVVKNENLDLPGFKAALTKYQISIKNVVVHASFLINLGNCIAENQVFEKSVKLFRETLEFADFIGVTTVVIHPGSYTTGSVEESIPQIVKGLDSVLVDHPKIKIALETMSGKGSEIGKNFAELKAIIQSSKFNNQIGLCLDTCHLYAAGYDIVNDLSGFFTELDNKIGLDKIFAVHLNDSQKELNSFRDRHANIGDGFIGFEAIQKFITHPLLPEVPILLETPLKNDPDIHKIEITKLKNQ